MSKEISKDMDVVIADMEQEDDFPSNDSGNTPFHVIAERAFNRRSFLSGAGALAATTAISGVAGNAFFAKDVLAANSDPSTLTFEALPHGYDETHHVAKGYDADILIRWGDPVEKDAPAFDPMNQTAEAQKKQFGYNNDFLGYTPLPAGSDNADHGLLCINHEYTNRKIMFPGDAGKSQKTQTKDHIDIEMAAHGHCVLEIKRDDAGKWAVVDGSDFNRRIHVGTEFGISGPAAGDDRLKTAADPTGTKVLGTINNCAGSITPWGTVLIAEENFHGYFGGDPAGTAEERNYKRYGMKGKPWYDWYRYHDRFDISKELNEPNRFGYMVELDPYDPTSTPIKRTALGRFKHEGAHALVNKDGRVVVYSGDDQRFDYVYKFVSTNKFDAGNREANFGILDDGILYVGKFNEDKSLEWLPLVYGEGPLTAENGFNSQADVIIETRRAADLLGATPMDRPEDVEPNLVTGVVYMMLTNNTKRKTGDENAANPRPKNKHGHIIEMIPPGGRGADKDHAATKYTWEFFLLAGDPTKPEDGAKYHPQVGAGQWLSTPDNCAFDTKGRIWIATDGAPKSGIADGVWAADTEGDGRAYVKLFFSTPLGAEHCGPSFNIDDTAYFRRRPASGRHQGFDLRKPVDPLAGIQGRSASQAVGRGHHQAGWRPDRQLTRHIRLRAASTQRRSGQRNRDRRGLNGRPMAARSPHCCPILPAGRDCAGVDFAESRR